MSVRASAPSNIALIKYMGKVDSGSNVPTNRSLSYTLEHLRTFVEIEPISGPADQWRSLQEPGLELIELGEKGQSRFLAHFQFLKSQWGVAGSFEVRSANNFPSDCGLASSASSFAALTRATAELAKSQNRNVGDFVSQAAFSRKGSGSSCRSFFGPWVLWDETGVRPLEFSVSKLWHAVVIVEGGKKAVSSSEAHRRVTSSLLFQGRPERAERRLEELRKNMTTETWRTAFELVWEEFWDMHALFETSRPPFGYFEAGSHEVLRQVRQLWSERGDGPLVTMDAGANVHLLFRLDQKAWAKAFLATLQAQYSCFLQPDPESA